MVSAAGATNRGVVYMAPGDVQVKPIAFPKLELDSTLSPVVSERQKRKCEHGAILKVVTTNICGSDQHMVRGRTSLPGGYMVLGHEITGEVIEVGKDVEFVQRGDVCSVPFNIACGRCPACKRGDTGVCLNVNPARAGAAYGYVDMGGWVGGQAEYVMVPYADFNLLKFPDREQAMEKITDLTLLSDIFPTGFHGAVMAKVGPGSIVYVAGAVPAPRCRMCHRRRRNPRAPCAGAVVWVRDSRHPDGRDHLGQDPRHHRLSNGRCGGRLCRIRSSWHGQGRLGRGARSSPQRYPPDCA